MPDLSDLMPGFGALTGFETTVHEIADHLFRDGIEAMSKDGSFNIVKADREGRRKFVAACHDGYMIGQRMLVVEMLRVQGEMTACKANLKDARRARDKEETIRVQLRIGLLTYQERILRGLANALVWILCRDRRWVVKRFHTGGEPPLLASSNYEHALRTAEEIHEEDPLSFALLADLTSIIQVGDLLLISLDEDNGARLGLVELKEGAVNEKVADFVDFFLRSGCMRAAFYFKEEHGEPAVEQAGRMLRQQARMGQVAQVVNTDHGTDFISKKPIILSSDEMLYHDYDDDLAELLDKATANGSACVVIDGCLALGVYDMSKVAKPVLAFSHDLFHHFRPGEDCPDPQTTDEETMSKLLKPPYPIYDVGRGITDLPLAKPLYLRRFSPDRIHDVLFGRLRIFVCFDGDFFFRVVNQMGLNLEWSTLKQARRDRSAMGGLYEVNRRYMIASKDGLQISLGHGLFSQVIYDGVKPSSMAEMIPGMLDLAPKASVGSEAED